MAIAFDAVSAKGQNNTSSVTLAFTIANNSNRLLLVGIVYQSQTGSITGITYAGTSMTSLIGPINFDNGTHHETVYIYGLLAPATGNNNIVVSKNESSAFVTFFGLSYYGVKQSGLPDASASTSNTNSTNPTQSVTTVADNTWIMGVLRMLGGTGYSAGSNTTIRDDSDSAAMVFDTNGAQTPAGAHSLNVNQATGDVWTFVAVSFAPFVTPSTRLPGSLALMGVGS